MPTPHPIGRLGLGTANLRAGRVDDAFPILDAWRGAGGRLIDTARNYGVGASERAIGAWLRARGTRNEIVLLTKGGHPDETDWSTRVTPEIIASDLASSLDRLGVPFVDIYLVHRDRPSVPVGEILDALAAEVAAGRAGSFGVSNWTIDRLDAGNAHAAARGWPQIAWSSPSLALATPTGDPWPGTVDAGDDASRSWYATHSTRVEAWSPTANGYFAEDADLTEARFDAYRTPANEARRARAAAFGAERGLTASQVALAWVVNQPFAPVAVLGTNSIAHLHLAVDAAAASLTADELAWLEHGDAAGGGDAPTTGQRPKATMWA